MSAGEGYRLWMFGNGGHRGFALIPAIVFVAILGGIILVLESEAPQVAYAPQTQLAAAVSSLNARCPKDDSIGKCNWSCDYTTGVSGIPGTECCKNWPVQDAQVRGICEAPNDARATEYICPDGKTWEKIGQACPQPKPDNSEQKLEETPGGTPPPTSNSSTNLQPVEQPQSEQQPSSPPEQGSQTGFESRVPAPAGPAPVENPNAPVNPNLQDVYQLTPETSSQPEANPLTKDYNSPPISNLETGPNNTLAPENGAFAPNQASSDAEQPPQSTWDKIKEGAANVLDNVVSFFRPNEALAPGSPPESDLGNPLAPQPTEPIMGPTNGPSENPTATFDERFNAVYAANNSDSLGGASPAAPTIPGATDDFSSHCGTCILSKSWTSPIYSSGTDAPLSDTGGAPIAPGPSDDFSSHCGTCILSKSWTSPEYSIETLPSDSPGPIGPSDSLDSSQVPGATYVTPDGSGAMSQISAPPLGDIPADFGRGSPASGLLSPTPIASQVPQNLTEAVQSGGTPQQPASPATEISPGSNGSGQYNNTSSIPQDVREQLQASGYNKDYVDLYTSPDGKFSSLQPIYPDHESVYVGLGRGSSLLERDSNTLSAETTGQQNFIERTGSTLDGLRSNPNPITRLGASSLYGLGRLFRLW